MPPSLETIFNQITDLLIHSLGFSQQGAEHQLSEIEKIIMAAIIKRMAEEKNISTDTLKTEKKLEQFFTTFSDDKKLKKIIEEESTRVLKDYFHTITASLANTERKRFYSSLQTIVA